VIKWNVRTLSSNADISCSCFILPFNNMRTLKFKAQPTNAVFRYRQSNFRRLLPAPTITVHLPYTVSLSELCSKIWLPPELGLGAAEHLIDGSEKQHLSVELWIFESACGWKAQYFFTIRRINYKTRTDEMVNAFSVHFITPPRVGNGTMTNYISTISRHGRVSSTSLFKVSIFW